MVDNNILLTQEGLETLQAEYRMLVDEKRPEVVARIDEARSHGDLSENEAYQDARREQAKIEGRIEGLESVFKNASVAEKGAHDMVQIGSRVWLERRDIVQEFLIVGDQEADVKNGRISYNSPIGEAVMGKKVGDRIQVEVPAGVSTFNIVDIAR